MADFDIDIGEIAEEDSYAVQGGMRNYVADEGMATVPRRWKSRPGQPETELAYITDKEAALLKKENIHKKDNPEDMGTVNVGPDGVPSYDDSGMASEDLYGVDESAYESVSQAALDLLNPTSQNVMSAAAAQQLASEVHRKNLVAAAATRANPKFAYDKGDDPNWFQRQWAGAFPPITPFGRHSGDFGIPDDATYRDFQFGRDVGFPMGLTGIPLMLYRLNRYQQRKNPHLERAEAMKAHTSSRYGPSWVYGQPKPKAKDYGDGGDHPLLKKPIPLGGVPSGVATPQGIVSGDTIFGDRTKTFTGFDPNATTAGTRLTGPHRSFEYSNPVVAQRGGLLDAAEIQRFQTEGPVKKPQQSILRNLFEPTVRAFANAIEPITGEFMYPPEEKPTGISGDIGYRLGAVSGLPATAVNLATVPVNLIGRGWRGLSNMFSSDPVVGPDYSSLDPAQETQMRNFADQMAKAGFLGTEPSHYDTGLADIRYDEDLGYATLDGAAIDTTSGLNRGGAIRSSDLAGDYGTMNRMISDPTGIASLGRGGDTMLVHMRPDEVAAMSMDGRTTVNPHTGLPERFWGATLGGLAGSFFGPWGVGIGSGLGQTLESKLGGAKTRDALTQGLYSGALAGGLSYGLGAYAKAGETAKGGANWFQNMLGSGSTPTPVMEGTGKLAGIVGNQVPLMTAGLSGLGGSALGGMAMPFKPPPEEEPITQRQAIARPKSARGISGDPATYGSGAEQYLLSRNKGIFDYTFAQEGGLMEAAQEEELVETSPDGVEMAYLQEDEEVMTPPGIPGMEEGMDIIVKEAVMAIRGEHPQPERAIAEYIEIYGEEDFAALQEMVTQDQALQGMGEAPVQVAEASETVEEMPLMAARGGALNGPGKGRDDQIPVLASDGEYIIAADVVSGLGDGSTKAGAQTLDAMADRVRQMRTGTEKQPEILPEEMALPA